MKIDVKSLTIQKKNGTKLLEDVNLKIDDGETVVLCGEPGSGKTLLSKAIKDILPKNLEKQGKVKIPNSPGYLFQTPRKQMLRRKVIDDLAFELENRKIEPKKIEERIEKYTDEYGIKNLLHRETEELSSGETAMVVLTQVLISEPDTIILDEPLTQLDYENQKIMIQQIKKLQEKGKTLIITEHNMEDLFSITDRIVLLKNGRIKSRGTPNSLIKELYSEGVKLPIKKEMEAEGVNFEN